MMKNYFKKCKFDGNFQTLSVESTLETQWGFTVLQNDKNDIFLLVEFNSLLGGVHNSEFQQNKKFLETSWNWYFFGNILCCEYTHILMKKWELFRARKNIKTWKFNKFHDENVNEGKALWMKYFNDAVNSEEKDS